jgi:hypothetical protein
MTRGLAKPAQARALMIAVATLGLLLVTFLVLSHDQRARAAFPGENGRIAFDSNRDGRSSHRTARGSPTTRRRQHPGHADRRIAQSPPDA